jgi:hypothetical protein
MSDDFIGIVAICGEEGTCKTSMALTFPKPLHHFDVDVGGYRRAAWRLSKEDLAQIVSNSYPKPIQIEKLLGQVGSPSSRVVIPKKVTGMKELWQQMVQDFVNACMDKDVKSIVIDSNTLLWNICHQSHLQELQERQLVYHKKNKPNIPFDENDYRERLQPMEYGPANDKMRTILHTARSFSKNLILTHYPTDEYGTIPDGKGNIVEGKTGNRILDGFKETVKLVDLVMWLSIKESVVAGKKEKQPIAKITKCGLEGMGLDAVGMDIPATYEGVINLQRLMRGEE